MDDKVTDCYSMFYINNDLYDVGPMNTPQVTLRRAQGDGLDGGLMTSEAMKHLAALDVPHLK